MNDSIDLHNIKNYFTDKIDRFGTTPRGADWNSSDSQEIRFEQLVKIIDASQPYTLIDYGSGYGALLDYLLRKGHHLYYTGYDIVEKMVEKGEELHPQQNYRFTDNISELEFSSYVIASGIFNIKMDVTDGDWTAYVLKILHKMNDLSEKGFSFNLLTRYSDPPLMRPDLYYADPCFFFDYCKKNFSKNVALLHDYGVYDFTILVRKHLT